ncbi:MAG TPA: helix-turn-helix domain-containing protein [Terriglobales bacterium]
MSREVRDLIFRMVAENPTWGAPRIHGELLKLGFEVSERTVSRWIKRASKNPDPARRWLILNFGDPQRLLGICGIVVLSEVE